MQNDSILVSKTLKGDKEAFSTLVLYYKDRIFNFLLKMTMSKEDAEDIVQEVFIRVYNNLYKYNARWCLSTWIFKIAINVFKSEYRKKKRFNNSDYQEILAKFPCNFSDIPETALELKENKSEIIKMLDSLKLDQKSALILKHVQGFSYKEIGEILNITPDNARVKVMRAKQALFNKYMKFSEVQKNEL